MRGLIRRFPAIKSIKNIVKIHIMLQTFKEMNAESCSAQTEKDFASKAGVPFIRINMGERKNCMSANPVRAARIKANAVQRHRATEPFA